MANVTYLLGAGASKERIPIVKSLSAELSNFCDLVEDYSKRAGPVNTSLEGWDISSTERVQSIKAFAEETRKLVNASATHATIDTYAKKLRLRGNNGREELQLLKVIFSIFLTWIQSKNRIYTRPPTPHGAEPPKTPDPAVDMRYDNFLASTLLRNSDANLAFPTIPTNIQFLTWNYDFQLELAYFGFIEDWNKTIETLSVPSLYYKINGSSLFPFRKDDVNDQRMLQKIFVHGEDFNFEHCFMLWHVFYLKRRSFDLLHFSFEDRTTLDLEQRLEQYQYTNSLVVVGYSFPHYNRTVDKLLLNSFLSMKTIYLQVPEEDYQSVYSRLTSIIPRWDGAGSQRIVPVKTVSSFYIPDELSP